MIGMTSCKKEEQEDPEFCQCGEVTSINQNLNQLSVKNNCTNNVYTWQLTTDEFDRYEVGDNWCTESKW